MQKLPHYTLLANTPLGTGDKYGLDLPSVQVIIGLPLQEDCSRNCTSIQEAERGTSERSTFTLRLSFMFLEQIVK